MEEESAAEQPPTRSCPHCGTPVGLAAAAPEDCTLACPGCQTVLSLLAEQDPSEPAPGSLEYAPPSTPPNREGDFAQELDGLRIKQVMTLRRGAARARSYLVIGVFASAVAAVKLSTMTADYVRADGWGRLPIGYVMSAIVALALVAYFGRRAMELHRELQLPPPLPPAPAEPDFSTLSDGSQHWKNLDEIR